MSRRQRTLLTISVRIPVPAGMTVEQTRAWVAERLTAAPDHPMQVSDFFSNQTQVKVTAKEVVYL